MALCRVFTHPSGEVSVMRLNPRAQGITFDGEVAKNPALVGLPFIDVDDSTLPTDRANRHKWRIKNGALTVDHAAQDKPDPKANIKARINQANNIADIKAILRDIV